MSTRAPVMMAPAPPPALTRGEAVGWYLRNLAIVMGAFFPSLVTAAVTADCMLRPAERACGFALGKVLFILIILGIPALVAGGAHLVMVLAIARRRPWLARVEAATLLPGLALVFGGVEWVRAHPVGLLVLAVSGALYAAMLRLDPRDRLGQAGWVWMMTPGLVVVYVRLFIAGAV